MKMLQHDLYGQFTLKLVLVCFTMHIPILFRILPILFVIICEDKASGITFTGTFFFFMCRAHNRYELNLSPKILSIKKNSFLVNKQLANISFPLETIVF